MDLPSLMQSLSINPSESAYNFHVTAVKIGENHTDLLYGEFVNKYMIIATQYGNAGGLIKITVDDVFNGDATEPVYTVKVLFGADKEEQGVAARYIAESLKIQKSLMLFLCLKDYERTTINTLISAILELMK